MKFITDLHIHSKFARACSPQLVPENIALWCAKKGIGIVGTGDFTHPGWMNELEEKLEEVRPGLYALMSRPSTGSGPQNKVNFIFSAEVSSIYKQGDKVRRVHNLVFAPSIEAAKKFNTALEKRGANLKSDGRPIMGVHCDELVKIAKDTDPHIEIIPAHAWTPHFGVFGSLSGFNSLEEAYGDYAKYIFAIETGLSSDPAMNWQVPELDSISLISNSDPHSLHRLGREANVLEVDPEKLSYNEIIRIIKNKDPKEFISTIEFFPEEGRYHLDGHRDCKFSCTPEETKRLTGVCPVCGKQLLKGVLNRVSALSKRDFGYKPSRVVTFQNLIPLEEIIAESFEFGVGSKKVQAEYERILAHNTEFEILTDLTKKNLSEITTENIVTSILRVRNNELTITPGYDGQYGTVHIYSKQEKLEMKNKAKPQALF